MSRYDLLEHFEKEVDPEELKKPKPKLKKQNYGNYITQDIFQDKRLNHLWAKAERSGFDCKYLSINNFRIIFIKYWI